MEPAAIRHCHVRVTRVVQVEETAIILSTLLIFNYDFSFFNIINIIYNSSHSSYALRATEMSSVTSFAFYVYFYLYQLLHYFLFDLIQELIICNTTYFREFLCHIIYHILLIYI